MGMILRDQDELDEARRHILLAARIRQEHDWKIPQELASAIGELDVDMAATVTAVDLHRALKKMWLAVKQADLPRVPVKSSSSCLTVVPDSSLAMMVNTITSKSLGTKAQGMVIRGLTG